MAFRWVIAGGGTGGHVTPALALGEAIVERGDEVLFIGSSHGLEARLVPDNGFELVTLPTQQVMGRSIGGRLRGAASILASVATAHRALRRFGADLVLSVGGYAAMPAALAARTARRPLFLVEPNAIPGRVNRLTARFARCVFVGFESAADFLPARTECLCLGVPLRSSLTDSFGAGAPERASGAPLHLLVFGGSQGARQLNESVPPALAHAGLREIEVFHQTGEADREAVEARYREADIPARVVAFERDMPSRYRWADLAVCRAGALTVAELALARMPALLVPYPFAADDHQAANARALEQAGAARCLEARPLDPEILGRAIAELAHAPERLAAMREAAGRLARPDAAREIVAHCLARLDGAARTHRASGDASRQPAPAPTQEEGVSCSAS